MCNNILESFLYICESQFTLHHGFTHDIYAQEKEWKCTYAHKSLMFMFVVTDMIRFKGTFLAIFYGKNHIFALIFEMEWCVLIPF